MEKAIFLVGFMGAGKSTIGFELAKQLQLPFKDSDLEIEKQNGLSISELFAKYGETGFRVLEQAWISENIQPAAVVALGGGAFSVKENKRQILEHGLVIYLKASVATLTQRLWEHANDRPLIKKYESNQKELEDYIRNTLKVRQLDYESATFTVDANVGVEETVAEILNSLQRHSQ